MEKWITLRFEKPGLLTTIQDGGRKGYQQYGVPTGGVMDTGASAVANTLVGNKAQSPVLEITFTGPVFQVDNDCQMALTGANISARINDEPLPLYTTVHVPGGSIISFGKLLTGCRAYLAIGGIWKAETWLGSVSPATVDDPWLTPDSIIRKGSTLYIQKKDRVSTRKAASPLLLQPGKERAIRILPGPEYEAFSFTAKQELRTLVFKVAPQSNRMGYRLEPALSGVNGLPGLISSGVVPGTLQITGNGQPILLLADAPTTGGYHRMANVISEDLDLLAQLKPGDRLRFVLISN